MNITKKQMAVLDFIKQFIAVNGYSPTVREICCGLGLKSPATVHDHLKKLINSGVITINPNKSRTIELLVDNEYLKSSNTCVKIPLYEKFPFDENNINYIDIPKTFLGNISHSSVCAFKIDNFIFILLKNVKTEGFVLVYNNKKISIKEYNSNLNKNIIGTIITKIEQYIN